MFLNSRFYIALCLIVLSFLIGFSLASFVLVGKVGILALILITLLDTLLLYQKKHAIEANRICPDKLSNGDKNTISIRLRNLYNFSVTAKVIDEIPIQFQKRDMSKTLTLLPQEEKKVDYFLIPRKRGNYDFGAINVLASSHIGLVSRRFRFDKGQVATVYPSFLQMRKYELIAISQRLTDVGFKKMRKIGHNMEFEQIRDYIQGDDYRSINWKATAKRSLPQFPHLMVNQYQDEKSQQVYLIIDKGRTMQSPFENMTLLDYAINASLAMANIIIKKQDKAGLVTFNHRIGATLKASSLPSQMNRFMEALYHEKTSFQEANFEELFVHLKRTINQRSLLIFFTNFATIDGLNRQLLFLRNLAKNHLIVVVFFEDTELNTYIDTDPKDVEGIYLKTIAEKFAYDKRLIVKELKKYGIEAILTKPQELTIQTINKYLELKARGLI